MSEQGDFTAVAPSGVELPDGEQLADVRLTRSCVSVYTTTGERIQLAAVWRWSPWRRALVAYSRRSPEWSPSWSRPLAEEAWANRGRLLGDVVDAARAWVLGPLAGWACRVVGGLLLAAGLVGLLVGGRS